MEVYNLNEEEEKKAEAGKDEKEEKKKENARFAKIKEVHENGIVESEIDSAFVSTRERVDMGRTRYGSK